MNGIVPAQVTQQQEKTDVPAQRHQAEREFSLTPPFVLFWSSTSWVKPTHIEKGNLLYSVYRFKR